MIIISYIVIIIGSRYCTNHRPAYLSSHLNPCLNKVYSSNIGHLSHYLQSMNVVFTNEAKGTYTHNVLYVNERLSNLGSTACKHIVSFVFVH